MNDPRSLVQEAGYVAVGLGVLAFQRAQVRRRELERQLADAGQQIDRLSAALEDARRLLEASVAEVRGRLPEQTLEAVDTAVGAARDATAQLLDLVRPASAA